MNEGDREVEEAERDASPERFAAIGLPAGNPRRGFGEENPRQSFRREYSRLRPDQREALHRTVTQDSSSSSSASDGSYEIQEIGQPTHISRLRTQTANNSVTTVNDLSRHPTETHPEAVKRIDTHRGQHLQTVGSVRLRQYQTPLPDFGANKAYPPLLPDKEEYVVEFNGHDDPLHPQNWPLKRKLGISAMLVFFAFGSSFGSSVFAPAARVVSTIYGVDPEVGTLAQALFVLGYAAGPIAWAPLSELYGRKLPLIMSAFLYGVFGIAVATAANLQTIEICRFFMGLMGSCPLTLVAAVFADIYDNKVRGLAIAVFASTVFLGPFMGPFIGGFITISYLGWRWTMYITSFIGFASCILITLFLQESYPPIVLVGKASELRRRTKNWGIHAKQEEVEIDLKELLSKNISRPLRILFTEPIVLAVTIYMSFIYGLLYLFLTAYALVFQGVYGMNPGVGGLPYFGMIIGVFIGLAVMAYDTRRYNKLLDANDGVPVPEWRMPVCVIAACVFPIGLFWFAWTGYQGSIPWIVPTLSGLCTGFGIYGVFISLLNYIVDAYLMFAASAIAANTLMRSFFGFIFPLFATYMYRGMHYQWASTLLGLVALVMIPMPVLFQIYGKQIRAKSKIAPALDLKHEAKKRDLEAAGADSSNASADEKKGSESDAPVEQVVSNAVSEKKAS